MGLDEMFGALDERAVRVERTCDVDMSDYFPGEQVITLREPDAPALFMAEEDAREVRKRHPDWTPALCNSIALLSASHVVPAPGSRSVGDFYCLMAQHHRDAFLHVSATFTSAFPALADFDGEKAAAKNDSGTASTG